MSLNAAGNFFINIVQPPALAGGGNSENEFYGVIVVKLSSVADKVCFDSLCSLNELDYIYSRNSVNLIINCVGVHIKYSD